MKALKNLGLAVLFLAAASCGNGNDPKSDTETQTTANVKDTVNAYVCPMSCENSGRSQAGACSVCGMELVQNKDFPGSAQGEMLDSNGSSYTNADTAVTTTN